MRTPHLANPSSNEPMILLNVILESIDPIFQYQRSTKLV